MDCMLCTWGWGWVGVRPGNNVHVNLNTCTHTSCYTLGSSLALAHIHRATLWGLLLHLHTYVMLRSGIFSCTWTHVMLRSGIYSCTCTHTSCYALGSSLALAHICHATLWDLFLHLHTYVMLRSGHLDTYVMLRSGIFPCTCTCASCYALGYFLAHISHSTHVALFLVTCA